MVWPLNEHLRRHWSAFCVTDDKRHTIPSKPCEVWKAYSSLAKVKVFSFKLMQKNASELVRICLNDGSCLLMQVDGGFSLIGN